jgi:hypothetical protein
MRTIGRHRPKSSPRGDVVALCDYCGVQWYRSQLVRDRSGLLVCPDEGDGKDSVTLSEANARAAASRTGPITYGEGGRKDSGGEEHKTTPQDIMGSLLLGWWDFSTMQVSGAPDDVTNTPEYSTLSAAIQSAYDEMALDDVGNSGVTSWRNRAKRYDYNEADGTINDVNKYLNLTSYGIYSPAYNDGDMRFRVSDDYLAGTANSGTRRLYTAKGDLVVPALSNPCVWVIFKPSADMVNSKNAYLFGLRTIYQSSFLLSSFYEVLGINFSSSTSTWRAYGIYNDNNIESSYADISLSSDTSRRVWSARMEALQLVLKVSDTEYAFTLPSQSADEGTKWDINSITLGDFINGEISEMVITSDVPTAAQISQLESYFKKVHTDIVETL